MGQINKILIVTLVATLFVFANLHWAVVAQSDEAPGDNTVEPGDITVENDQITQVLYNLFDALRTGDISSLKLLFAEEMYAKNKTLLENNAQYSDFLINFYRGVTFEVAEISAAENGLIASFTSFFPDGSKKDTHLLMIQRARQAQQEDLKPGLLEVSPNGWVIINQILE